MSRDHQNERDRELVDGALEKMRLTYGAGFLVVLFALAIGALGATTLQITIALLVLILVLGTIVIRRRRRQK
jgi:hypothetical protein